MADLKTATKVGNRLREIGRERAFAGSIALGAGIGLTAGAVTSGPVGIMLLGGASLLANAVGLLLMKSNTQLKGRARSMDVLIKGQTKMGALYGRKVSTVAPSLGVQRAAAGRTTADMGKAQTIGAGRFAASAALAGGDGQTQGYTRMQNGRSVFVRGYATPAK